MSKYQLSHQQFQVMKALVDNQDRWLGIEEVLRISGLTRVAIQLRYLKRCGYVMQDLYRWRATPGGIAEWPKFVEANEEDLSALQQSCSAEVKGVIRRGWLSGWERGIEDAIKEIETQKEAHRLVNEESETIFGFDSVVDQLKQLLGRGPQKSPPRDGRHHEEEPVE